MFRVNLILQYVSYKLLSPGNKGNPERSPVTFDFIENVLERKEKKDIFAVIENYRKRLKNDRTTIPVDDHGAHRGKRAHAGHKRIRRIACSAPVNKKSGRMLFFLSDHYRLPVIVELGTSLGIGTMYLAAGNRESKVFTIEGDRQLCEISGRAFKEFGFNNVLAVQGLFDDTLAEVLDSSGSSFIAFIDGNHKGYALLRYMDLFMKKAGPESIIVLHDIRWSAEMFRAWNIIRNNAKVTVSVDLFFTGILFFRKNGIKKHFRIRF